MLALGLLATPLHAQTTTIAPPPEAVSVSIYRAPNRSADEPMNLRYLRGFALVTETRRVTIVEGDGVIRFEGVAGGILPESAIVTGLPDGVVEKNQDANLLSPAALLGAATGRRVTLKRTNRATGKVTEQDAIVRASGNDIVVQTATGVEALRCTGLNETLLAPGVPADLSAKPTLSVRARSTGPIEATVTLTYLTSNFDWRAHYVATLAPDGKTMSLFAWLTLANGDETGFVNADTMAVAGRLNREDEDRLETEARSISLNCWPGQRTHQIPADQITVQMRAPNASLPEPEYDSADSDGAIVVTGSRVMAEREDLGDLKLYRIPIPVSVASNSQKQVALLEQPRVRFTTEYQWAKHFNYATDEPEAAAQTLLFDNVEKEGLGLPLPAGSFTFYAMRGNQPFLLGEGEMTDRAVNEKIEVPLTDTPGVRVMQRQVADKDGVQEVELDVTNDLPHAIRFTTWTGGQEFVLVRSSAKLTRDRLDWRWRTSIPANGSKTLRIRYRDR